MISLTEILDETVAFAKKEAEVLAPLTFATLVVADAGRTLVAPALGERLSSNPPASLAFLAMLLLSVVGQLAVTSLVLLPEISLKGALNTAIARLPKVIGIGLMLLVALALLTLPPMVMLGRLGYDVLGGARPPAFAQLYFMVIGGFAIWVGVRLSMITPLIIERNPPLVQVFSTAFDMTRGWFFRLFGIMLLFLLLSTVVGSATTFVFGGLFALLGKATGLIALFKVSSAFITGIVGGVLSLGATLYIAHLYRAIRRA